MYMSDEEGEWSIIFRQPSFLCNALLFVFDDCEHEIPTCQTHTACLDLSPSPQVEGFLRRTVKDVQAGRLDF